MTLDVIFDRPLRAADLGAPSRIRTRDPLLEGIPGRAVY